LLSLSLPIYWEKNKAAVDEEKAKKRSFEQLKVDTENRITAAVAQASFDLRDAERKISLYRNTLIPKTNESIEASYTAYQSGDATFLDVIDSEQSLLEFRLALNRAQADAVIARAKLQQLAGGFSETGD
jgi:outer membrane protein TolC